MRSGLHSADSLAAPKTAHVLDPSDLHLRRLALGDLRLDRNVTFSFLSSRWKSPHFVSWSPHRLACSPAALVWWQDIYLTR